MAVMTQKQIEKLLQKKAKGFVTEMAKACEKLLKHDHGIFFYMLDSLLMY